MLGFAGSGRSMSKRSRDERGDIRGDLRMSRRACGLLADRLIGKVTRLTIRISASRHNRPLSTVLCRAMNPLNDVHEKLSLGHPGARDDAWNGRGRWSCQAFRVVVSRCNGFGRNCSDAVAFFCLRGTHRPCGDRAGAGQAQPECRPPPRGKRDQEQGGKRHSSRPAGGGASALFRADGFAGRSNLCGTLSMLA